MKKNNALFLVLTAASVILTGAIITENITALNGKPKNTKTLTCSSSHEESETTKTIRQNFNRAGLPLHEGKHWKKDDE
jgi:hypothetical protein